MTLGRNLWVIQNPVSQSDIGFFCWLLVTGILQSMRSERSEAWLSRLVGGQEIAGSGTDRRLVAAVLTELGRGTDGSRVRAPVVLLEKLFALAIGN